MRRDNTREWYVMWKIHPAIQSLFDSQRKQQPPHFPFHIPQSQVEEHYDHQDASSATTSCILHRSHLCPIPSLFSTFAWPSQGRHYDTLPPSQGKWRITTSGYHGLLLLSHSPIRQYHDLPPCTSLRSWLCGIPRRLKWFTSWCHCRNTFASVSQRTTLQRQIRNETCERHQVPGKPPQRCPLLPRVQKQQARLHSYALEPC